MLNVTNLCGFIGNSTKPWSIVGVGTTDTGSNPQPGNPSDTQAGDLLVICIANDDSVISTPSGWTLLSNSNTAYLDVNIYARVADGSATDNPTIVTPSTLSRAVMFAMRNIQNNPYLDVSGSHNTAATESLIQTLSITTNYDNEPVISIFAVQDNVSPISWTPPAGTTTIYNVGSTTTVHGLLIVYETQVLKGSTTVRTANTSPSADSLSAYQVAFRQE